MGNIFMIFNFDQMINRRCLFKDKVDGSAEARWMPEVGRRLITMAHIELSTHVSLKEHSSTTFIGNKNFAASKACIIP